MGGSPSTLPPLRFPRRPAHAGSLGAGACGLSRRQSTRAALGKELVLSPRGRIRLHLRVARRRSRPSAKIDTFGSIHNRSEEHTSELQSRFGISYAVFLLKK